MTNLWNLNDIDKKVSNSPNLILVEQAKYFEKSLKEVLYARISNTTLKASELLDYKLATNFSIVSPTLDNYTYTLFTVYSNPESNYPLGISVNTNNYNIDILDVDYTCNNETEFIDKLSEILSSEKTTEIITVLYSKSRNF